MPLTFNSFKMSCILALLRLQFVMKRNECKLQILGSDKKQQSPNPFIRFIIHCTWKIDRPTTTKQLTVAHYGM